MRDYYLENSLGKCDNSTIVAPLYVARHARAYYTDRTIAYGVRAQELIQKALAFHLGRGLDFSKLTVDSHNYVYAVNVFYAGEVVNNWGEGLWPHSHFLSQPVDLGSSHIAHDYQITSIGQRLELGAYCHENGHMGRDVALPSTGLAVWHVDERGDNSRQEGTPSRHYECALIQADGQKHLENNVNPGDETHLFQNSALRAAKWWDQTAVGLTIAEISAAGRVMSFRVRSA